MRDFGVIHCSYWTSETSHGFSDDAKLLGAYLFTGPHSNILGCYRVPDGYVMGDLSWAPERVSKAFEELSRKGFANRCGTTFWVFIVKYLKWNPPENPNQVKAMRRLAAQVPDNAAIKNGLEAALNEACGPAKQVELFDEKQKPLETLVEPLADRFGIRTRTRTSTKTEKEPSPEASSGAPPVNGSAETAMMFPLVGGKQFAVSKAQVLKWAELYPAVDVMQEVRKMAGWLDSNPKNRKTSSGIMRFANRWLSGAQDRAPVSKPGGKPASKGNTQAADELIDARKKQRETASGVSNGR